MGSAVKQKHNFFCIIEVSVTIASGIEERLSVIHFSRSQNIVVAAGPNE